MLAILSQAQAVFQIKSPPSIQGYYTISVADSTVHYWGNGSVAKKSVEAELMLATGVDSVASGTLKGDYNGKIAIIFRGGGVAFGTKALRAQTAGAVAVVIVNHGIQPNGSVNGDELFTMAGGTSYTAGDGAQVKIPVVMISKNSYLKLSPVLRSGESVIGYVGGKQSLDYDLKLSPDLLILPAKATRPKSIVRAGMVSDTLGFSLINNGDQDQTNIGVRAIIVKGLDTLYNKGLYIDKIASKDTIGYYFFSDQSAVLPFRPTDDLDTGRYDLTFSVVNLNEVTFNDTLIDQYDQDNVVKTSFYVTDSIYSIAKMSSYKASNGKTFNNVPIWGTATRPGSSYTNYSSCIVYKDDNVSNLEASSMTFMAYMTSGVLKDNLFKINVYEWNDPFVDIRDTAFKFKDLNPLVDNQEYISKDSLAWDYQIVKFDQAVKLNAGQRYLFCVTTSNPNVMFGFDDDAPSLRASTLIANREPLFAIAIDGNYYSAGWSPGYKYIPTISINVSEPSCISASVKTTNETRVGAKDGTAEVVIDGSSNGVTFLWNDKNQSKTKSLQNLEPGKYTVTISVGDCKIEKSVTIKKYECKLVHQLFKKDESVLSGNNGEAKIRVQGGTIPYSYSWNTNPVQTDTIITKLSPGKYTVNVEDAAGCSVIDSVVINPYVCNLSLLVSKTDETGYGLNDGTATANVNGGVRPFTYSWNSNPVQTDSIAKNLTPGKYTVTVSDKAGCLKTDSIEIKKYNCNISIIVNKTDETKFGSNDGTAIAKVTKGKSPFIYTWNSSPVQTDSLASKLAPGKYKVTVKDADECVIVDSVEIKPFLCNISLVINQTSETGVGFNDGTAKALVSGGTRPFIYSWNTSPVQTDSIAKNLAAGKYFTVSVKDASDCIVKDSISIDKYICDFNISLSKEDETGVEFKDGKAKVVCKGGKSPFLYSWSTLPVQTDSIAIGLAPGKYSVTVKDAAGCIVKDSVLIKEYVCQGISVKIKPTQESGVNKKDATAEVFVLSGGNAPYSYEWLTNPVQTSKIATNLSSGILKVIVSDSKGCKGSSDTIITTVGCDLSIELVTTHESKFKENDGKIKVVVKGGEPKINFDWSNSASQSDSAFGLKPGIYKVTATDKNGCKSEKITEVKSYVCNLSYSVNASNESFKGKNDAIARVKLLSGLSPYTFTWNSNPTLVDSVIKNLSPGKYVVLVKDAANCSKLDSIQITEGSCKLSVLFNKEDVTANNANDGKASVTVKYGISPYIFAWNTNPIQTDSVANGLAPGKYIVSVKDAVGCIVNDSVVINNFSCNILLVLNKTDETGIGFNDGIASVNATGGIKPYTYSWNSDPVQTDSVVKKLAPNKYYTVTVKDATGCKTKDSIQINKFVCKLSLTISKKDESGFGLNNGSAYAKVIGGRRPFEFTWNTNPVQKDSVAKMLTPGKYYSVTVKDTTGCQVQDSIKINSYVCPNMKIETVSKEGNAKVNVLKGGVTPYSYSWNSIPPQDSPISTKNIVSGLTNGMYVVTVTDSRKCTVSDTFEVKISSALLTELNLSNISIYPNPVTEQLNISFSVKNQALIILSGISGNIIDNKTVNGVVKTTFDTSNLSSGIYLVTIKVDSSSYTYKVIKE